MLTANILQDFIIRHVTVNRDFEPKQMVGNAGREQYVDEGIVKTIPRQGSGVEDIKVYFFNYGCYLTIAEQKNKLAALGLVPDYYAQIQVNIDDPFFADKYPNSAQWNVDDEKGASYFAFFSPCW